MKFFSLLFSACLVVLCKADVQFHITNSYGEIIWIGILGNNGRQPLNNGGFKLDPGATQTVSSPDDWQGRFWARTGCDDQTQHCVTGDCGNKLECAGAGGVPPVTLAEITLKGDAGLDYYDISLVDGFNIGASIEPVNGEGGCKKGSCGGDINGQCPPELQVKDNDQVVSCNSACNAFHTDEYCCAGVHNTRETCQSSDWPHNYPAEFKKICPDAYTYAFDDPGSLLTCKASEYNIAFGNV